MPSRHRVSPASGIGGRSCLLEHARPRTKRLHRARLAAHRIRAHRVFRHRILPHGILAHRFVAHGILHLILLRPLRLGLGAHPLLLVHRVARHSVLLLHGILGERVRRGQHHGTGDHERNQISHSKAPRLGWSGCTGIGAPVLGRFADAAPYIRRSRARSRKIAATESASRTISTRSSFNASSAGPSIAMPTTLATVTTPTVVARTDRPVSSRFWETRQPNRINDSASGNPPNPARTRLIAITDPRTIESAAALLTGSPRYLKPMRKNSTVASSSRIRGSHGAARQKRVIFPPRRRWNSPAEPVRGPAWRDPERNGRRPALSRDESARENHSPGLPTGPCHRNRSGSLPESPCRGTGRPWE